jgi:hypothetical protein
VNIAAILAVQLPDMRCFRLLAPALLLLATGCAPMQWVREGAGPEQVRQDDALCQREAWREASWRAWFYRPAMTTILDREGRPFFIWPYSPFGDPFGDRLMEEARLASFCMRAKGYGLAPLKPQPQ